MKTYRLLIYTMIILCAAANSARSGWKHPCLFLTRTEINAIKEKIKAGEEPWKSAWGTKDKSGSGWYEAEKAMRQEPLSIVGAGDEGRDKLGYYGNGEYNEHIYNAGSLSGDRIDYKYAIAIKRAVRDLAIGWTFSGDSKYAEKALELIRVWALDEETRMWPVIMGRQQEIEIGITMPGFLYGCDLLWHYEGWKSGERENLRQWAWELADYCRHLIGSYFCNQMFWLLETQIAGAMVGENEAALVHAKSKFKYNVGDLYDNGWQPNQDINRSKMYCYYAIKATTQCAEGLKRAGIDVYNFVSDRPDHENPGMETILDGVMPYVNGKSFPFADGGSKSEEEGFVEPAYLFKQKDEYRKAAESRRIVVDSRNMGNTTLTHAFGSLPNTGIISIFPVARNFNEDIEVTLSSSNPDAVIRYTLDGSEPSAQSTKYDGPFTISNTTKVMVRAFIDGKGGYTAHAVYTKKSGIPAVQPSEIKGNGLSYLWYDLETTGKIQELPDFSKLTPDKTGIVDTISLPDHKTKQFGLRLTGYLKAPASGMYLFYGKSNDGMKLYIGDSLIINTPRLRNNTWPWDEGAGIELEKGYHPILIDYYQNHSARQIYLTWESTQFDEQFIPAQNLFWGDAEYQLPVRSGNRFGQNDAMGKVDYAGGMIRCWPAGNAHCNIRLVNSRGITVTPAVSRRSGIAYLDTKKLPSGMYILRADTEAKSMRRKIIIP